MKRKILAIAFLLLISFLVFYGGLLILDLYIWPKVSQCPACGKTIWAWQDHERMEYEGNVKMISFPPGVALTVVHSSLFHASCEGEPERPEIRAWMDTETGKINVHLPKIRVKEAIEFILIEDFEKEEAGLKA